MSESDDSSRGFPGDFVALARELPGAIAGELRTDRLARALYATDASIYEIVPDGVIFPKSVADVIATVKLCARHGVPLTARGAGTGLAGGAVNRGLQLDCSRHLDRILGIDPQTRTARVEPGVILDQLNAEAKRFGLQFAPDVATSSRATIGGMIANNSCGAHSILYGRTVDHVLGVDVVLADGSTCTWGNGSQPSAFSFQPLTQSGAKGQPDGGGRDDHSTAGTEPDRYLDAAPAGRVEASLHSPDNQLARQCDAVLAGIVRDYADEIVARFPKVLRSNGGYALDRLRVTVLTGGQDARPALQDARSTLQDARPTPGVNTETIICGSEGTLGIIVGATLRLIPLPRHKALLIVQFEDVLSALQAVCPILEHRPAAVELIDDLILDATKNNPTMARKRWFIDRELGPSNPAEEHADANSRRHGTRHVSDGEPKAILVCEMFDDDEGQLGQRLRALEADLKTRTAGIGYRLVVDPAQQADVWDVRKSGLGLLMSRPGDRQPYAFIEDTAVDPARLPEYIRRLDQLLAEEGVEQTGHYAHASVGCLHVRPVLNLKERKDIERMRRIAERVSSLVLEFGGTMNGEHGDGIVCSVWLEKMYGPRIVEAFRKIKQTFDPQGIFNPGKIVDPLPLAANLRYGEGFESQQPATVLDFAVHGGMAGLAGMCTGVGLCRQRFAGTMCPSYMATGDETHTTRARANALRVALSNRGLLDGLADPALDEVMDLCLSCKACRTECPTGVDMSRLKAEWLAHRNERVGVPRRSRLIASSIDMARWGCHFAPLSNWVMQSRAVRVMMEHVFGLDRRMPPPRFAHPTFRQWFAGRIGNGVRNLLPEGPSGRSAQKVPDTFSKVLGAGDSRRPQVVYFADTWTNFYEPQVGRAAVKVLEAMGFEVIVPPTVCCGRPLISKGLLRDAVKLAETNVAVLGPYADRGIPIVGTEPSCVSVLLDELPQLVRSPASSMAAQSRGHATACRIAACATTIETFVAGELRKNPDALHFRAAAPESIPSSARPKLLYHGHCHQKALTGTADAIALLAACTHGGAAEIDSGCCGMAGAFGHEVEHYDVARAVGEQRLFPAIRARGEAGVAVSGFSCRHHIAHHTGVPARHVIEYVADAML